MKKGLLIRSISLVLAMLCCCGCLFACNNADEPSETEKISVQTTVLNEPDDSEPDKGEDTTPVTKVETPLLDEIIANTKHKLCFREDGSFKVLTLGDIQYRLISEEQKALIKAIIDREDPDLVIFTGDNCRYKYDHPDNSEFTQYVSDMVGYIEEKEIPWCHVFGNHDAEDTNLSKERQQAVYESFEYCVSSSGPEDINGIGNYVLPVYSSDGKEIRSAVWCLDSGMYTSDGVDTSVSQSGTVTDYIRQNQVDWYKAISAELTAQNGGVPVYGMMAFHIPLQESVTAWDNREILGLEWNGEKRETICCSPYHSTLFEAIKACGDVKAIANAHDHINDYALKYQGVWLTCGGSAGTSTNTSRAEDMLGGRVFVLNEENPENINTYTSYIPKRK